MNNNKIPILTYHSISNEKLFNSINVSEFKKQISYFREKKFDSIHINETNANIKNKIILTFDDGYKDINTHALPILKEYNFKAICFIVSNHIGKNNIWDKHHKKYQKKELMSKRDINEWLNNDMLIGSHSHNHFNLSKLDNNELNTEINLSKDVLQETFSTKVSSFCYPYGKIDYHLHSIVKKSYDYAFTTNRSRYIYAKHDPHLLPRIDMGRNTSKFKIFLKLKTFYEDIKFIKNEI